MELDSRVPSRSILDINLDNLFDSTSSDEVELPSLPEAPQLENDIKNPLGQLASLPFL